MDKIHCLTYDSPLGKLKLGVFDNKLCLCDWLYRRKRKTIDSKMCRLLQATMRDEKHPVHQLATEQLGEYFEGCRRIFDLPLSLVGTSFQVLVWRALLDVSYGHTSSYAELAIKLDCPSAVRAVAAANGANSLAIVVPCHRIIGKKGQLVGYAGGLELKKALLRLEKVHPFHQPTLF